MSSLSPLKLFWLISVIVLAVTTGLALLWSPAWWLFIVIGPLFVVGVADTLQTRQAVIRNFPVIGHLRYMFESVRPEIQQYFVESDTSGRPFSRELRSVVYQRAKSTLDTRPFGTIRDLDTVGTEWIAHSMQPVQAPDDSPRIVIGGNRCSQPYSAALLNISAMSFGSLSKHAILALNGGAKLGNFAHNTGEGGISPYHLEPGGDLIWQIGTGYFGCRRPDGGFDADKFEEKARLDVVKMIEIKISQGAKPGHGGILPASKVTPEIAEIRGVPLGHDVISPAHHSAFGTPLELIRFIGRLRKLSGGKPVGFKLCVGEQREFLGICKAMLEADDMPDFITVDGAEGGTGAAPLEFTNSIGMPLTDGLLFVHNALRGCGLREQVHIICAGKIATGFGMAQRMAIGADLCNAARTMMFALGCIQAIKCNTNRCPVGVATQDPDLVRGLDIADKTVRVANYQKNTVESLMEILGAAGLTHPDQLKPKHIQRRISFTEVASYAEIYDYLESGVLLADHPPPVLEALWHQASADKF